MAQIDDFFMYENRVEGITDAEYQRAHRLLPPELYPTGSEEV